MTKIVTFNVKNVRAAMRLSEKTFGPIIPMGKATQMSLEVETTDTPIQADGEYQCSFANTSVGSGSITLLNISDEFEIAVGRKMETDKGIIDLMQNEMKPFALLFDVSNGDEEGEETPAKNIAFFCTSPKAAALKVEQNAQGVKISNFELPIKFSGKPLTYSDGTIFLNEKKRTKLFWKQTVTPSDPGFDTFGDTVVIPTITKE